MEKRTDFLAINSNIEIINDLNNVFNEYIISSELNEYIIGMMLNELLIKLPSTSNATAHRIIDIVESPVIEFSSLRYRHDDPVYQCRLYAVTDYTKNGASFTKDEGFIKWSNRIFKVAKLHFEHYEDGFYYGEGAWKEMRGVGS